MHFHLTEVSRNRKTGPIPVATISRASCPSSCPLIGDGGCYAEGGPLRIHWNEVSNGTKGTSFEEFLDKIRRLPRRQLWRYGQAGDLPGADETIDRSKLQQLTLANRRRHVIAFTHYPPTPDNLETIREAEEGGFLVNLSADDLVEADAFADFGMPAVVVLPLAYQRRAGEELATYRARLKELGTTTPKGRRIAVCPATYTDTRCSECQACAQRRSNDTVIGFPAHGTRRHRIVTEKYRHTPGASSPYV